MGPDGVITTLAAGLGRLGGLAAAPGGAVVVATGTRVLRLAPDGAVAVLAGG